MNGNVSECSERGGSQWRDRGQGTVEGAWPSPAEAQAPGSAYLTPRDVHEHGEAARMAALAHHMAPVPGLEFTAPG